MSARRRRIGGGSGCARYCRFSSGRRVRTDKILNPQGEGDIGYRHFHGDWYTFTSIDF